MQADVVVVGAGLAGLSCALELTACRRGVLLLEGRRVVGGRTSSWDEDGMRVESGLHRVLGFYAAFPDLLRKAGLLHQACGDGIGRADGDRLAVQPGGRGYAGVPSCHDDRAIGDAAVGGRRRGDRLEAAAALLGIYTFGPARQLLLPAPSRLAVVQRQHRL